MLILYARNAFTGKETFRATLAAVWICINGLLLIRLAWSGQFQMRVLPVAGVAALVVTCAGLAAERLVARFSHRAFMILISLLLLLSGGVTLFRAV